MTGIENDWTREIERLRAERITFEKVVDTLAKQVVNLKVDKAALLEACKESIKWFGKLASDHDGDPVAETVMRHSTKVEAAIARAERE